MTWTKTEVLMWAERIIPKKNGPAHLVLEIAETSTPDQSQAAFHKIARTAHPDLHRNALTPDELEKVTSAYAAVAGAYMQMRSQTMQTNRMKPLKNEEVGLPPKGAPVAGPSGRTPPAGVPTRPPPAASSAPPQSFDASTLSVANAAQQMGPKAIAYFRKAEAALKRGDLKSAVLQIKLAIAADPASTFLRNALAEVDAELRKST